MKLIIRSNEGPKRLTLPLPLWLLKSRLAMKALSSSKDFPLDVKEVKDELKTIYTEIKKYKKKYGHFDLVNIESHDGEKVIIRI